jgi:leucyl-tRNA synthetase
VHRQPWPQWDATALVKRTVELPVQVNGRVRDRIVVPVDADATAITSAALASERVRLALNGAAPRRVVVVPGRTVNVVV